jgi:hypothetical protein
MTAGVCKLQMSQLVISKTAGTHDCGCMRRMSWQGTPCFCWLNQVNNLDTQESVAIQGCLHAIHTGDVHHHAQPTSQSLLQFTPQTFMWVCPPPLPLQQRLHSPVLIFVQRPGEGLLVELDERRVGRPTSGAAVAAQWFAQDLFDQADLEEDNDEETLPVASAKQLKAKKAADIKTAQRSQSGSMTQLQRQALTQAPAAAAAAAADDDDSAAASSEEEGRSDGAAESPSSSSDDDDDEGGMPTVGPSTDAAAAQLISKSGFEEVPVSRRHADSGAASSDDSSDDGFDDLDDDGKAEVLALARKMLKGRDRQDIMDAAYHRYAFHESGLPRWFEEDEAKHMK